MWTAAEFHKLKKKENINKIVTCPDKEIVQAHGENINVISTEGVGTEFIFTLPLSKKEGWGAAHQMIGGGRLAF